MRIYLVIMDETPESRTALRFASRRALDTGGAVHIIAVVPKQQFVAFGGVQATIEDEEQKKKDKSETEKTKKASAPHHDGPETVAPDLLRVMDRVAEYSPPRKTAMPLAKSR